MKRLTGKTSLALLRRQFEEMLSPESGRQYEFRREWAMAHGWQVVPVESAARLPAQEVPRLAESLRTLGHSEIVAVNTDMPIQEADVYEAEVSPEGLTQLNRELGPFRFLITAEGGQWGISCNEWYNLFGAAPLVLVELLGRPIEQARAEFAAFTAPLGEPLVSVGPACSKIGKPIGKGQ